MKELKILIVAGEASSDLHASLVIERLKQKRKVKLLGIGGDRLIKQGLIPAMHAKEMAVVGLWEALKHIPQSLRLFQSLAELAEKEKPDFALLLDLPDFNLRLAPRLKNLGFPILYYISPQVWAWRSKRVQHMAKVIDKLLCILPFEKDWFTKNAPKDFSVQYVGHPALEEIPMLAYEPKENCIALLPGSRRSEFRLHLEEMLRAAALLQKEKAGLHFELPLAETLRNDIDACELLKSLLEKYQVQNIVQICEEPAYQVLQRAKLAIVASGTATLETAIVGTPMIVVYRVSPVTAFLFKNFVQYAGPIAMVNLIHNGIGAKETLVPELIQSEMNAENIAKFSLDYLSKPTLWQKQASALQKTRTLLQTEKSPVDAVVDEIMKFAS